jgi:NADH:ubiquinone oxidoreductase subunit E
MSCKLDIRLCMGSSCFSRGNNRNIETLKRYLAERGIEGECALVGHLCQNDCNAGPNLILNGCTHHEVDPVTLLDLVNERLAASRTEEGT